MGTAQQPAHALSHAHAHADRYGYDYGYGSWEVLSRTRGIFGQSRQPVAGRYSSVVSCAFGSKPLLEVYDLATCPEKSGSSVVRSDVTRLHGAARAAFHY